MAEKHAEPSWAVFSDAATSDDTVQRDRLAVASLQRQEAWPVLPGVTAGKVADFQSFHPDGYSVPVVGIIVLGHHQRVNLGADPVIVTPAVRTDQLP